MNEILHSICNRGTGWASNAFPASTTFVPAPPDDVLDPLRTAAGLDANQDVFYTIGALGVIAAVPEIEREFKELGRNYDTSLYVRRPDQFTNGSLRANRNGPARVNRIPTEWPVRMDIVLEALDASSSLLRYGAMNDVVSSQFGNGYVSVDWPTAVGITGRIERASWSAGDTMTIWHEPGSFPVQALVTSVSALQQIHIALGAAGLASAFHQTDDVVEKAAIFYLALGKLNRAVYPKA